MPEKSIYGGSEKDYSGIMSKPSSRPTEMFEAAARPQVKEKVQRDIKQEVQRKQQEKSIVWKPKTPVDSGGKIDWKPKSEDSTVFSGGNWNGGFENDEDSMRERILDDYDISKHQHLVNTVKHYSKPWLGASNQWGNYHDDMKITQAAKFSLSFMGKLLGVGWEIPLAWGVKDPATNIHKQMQDMGLALKQGETRVATIPVARGGFGKKRTITTVGGDSYKTGEDIGNVVTIGTAIVSAPSIIKLSGMAIVGGYKKFQNFFKPKSPIKGKVIIDDLTNTSVGASYQPQKFVKKLNPDEIAPEVEGYTGYVTLVNKYDGKEFSGITYKKGDSFWTNTDTHRWTDGNYYTGKYNDHFSNINPAQPLEEVVVYHKNTDTILSRFDEQLPIKYETTTADNSGVLLHHHMDEAYQINQSFVEGVPIVTKWNHAENRLNDVIYKNYIDTNSKLRIAYDKAGVTPQSNPSLFTYITRDGVPVPIPKITYHGTSKIFVDGLKGTKEKISSPDGSQFIGGTDNLEKTLGYIMDTEVLGTNIVVPRIYISFPIPKKTFDITRNNEHLEFAINHIANQRYNNWQGNKVLKWDEFDDIDLPYQSDINIIPPHKIKEFKAMTVDDWKIMVEGELLDDASNWKSLEKEMRVFDDTGTVTPNHVIQDKGFDSFVTVEHAADPLYEFKGDMNIMIFEPEKNLLPISTVVDDLKPLKYSEFLSQQLQKPNVSYGGGYRTIGQYMHEWASRASLRPDIKAEGTGTKLLLELLGDAGDVIKQPTTPFIDAKQQLSSEFV